MKHQHHSPLQPPGTRSTAPHYSPPSSLTSSRMYRNLSAITLVTVLFFRAPTPAHAAAAATMPTVPIPSATNIVARLRPEHPRLLATKEDFAELKKRIASDSQL